MMYKKGINNHNSIGSGTSDSSFMSRNASSDSTRSKKFNISKYFPVRLGSGKGRDRSATNLVFDDQQLIESNFMVETQKPLHQFDELQTDILSFIHTAGLVIEMAKKTNTKAGVRELNPLKALNKWQTKRKGNRLFSSYLSLVSRCDEIDLGLRYLVDDSTKNGTNLLLQAETLKPRLQGCVEYNSHEVQLLQPGISEARSSQAHFRAEKMEVLEMLCFFDELTKLKETQYVPYVPWAQRTTAAADSSTDDSTNSSSAGRQLKRKSLERRLAKLEIVLKIFDSILQREGPQYECKVHNYDHCSRSLQVLNSLTKKTQCFIESDSIENPESHDLLVRLKEEHNNSSNDSAVGDETNLDDGLHGTSDNSNSNTAVSTNLSNDKGISGQSPATEIESDEPSHQPSVLVASLDVPSNNTTSIAFDHSRCVDCSCNYILADECAMRLAATQHFAVESVTKLKHLRKLRGTMKESALLLDELDWGGSDHHLENL